MMDYLTVEMKKNITDDVWFEIFLHLPYTAIFKFKSVSKVWLSTLSSPNFVMKWYKLNCSSLPWAIIDYAIDLSSDNKLRKVFAIAYPDSHSQFINGHQYGFSLNFLIPNFPNISNDEEEEREEIFIRSSSNGLVLCSVRLSKQITLLYVCNPLTQKWILLPPPPTQIRGVMSLMCNESFSSSLVSESYKIIHIPRFEDAGKEFKVDVFCSDLGKWNTYDVSCPPDVTCRVSLFDCHLTYNGVFYWFQKRINTILAFSTNHGTCGIQCRWINLPDQGMDAERNRCIGESEGLICYAIVKDGASSLSVWALDEDWYLLHKEDKFNDMLAQMVSRLIGEATTAQLIARIRVLGFNPVDKYVVILGYRSHVWSYNTKTRACEQLCHPFFPVSNLPSVADMYVFPFAFKPRPTILPTFSCRDTSTSNGNMHEIDN